MAGWTKHTCVAAKSLGYFGETGEVTLANFEDDLLTKFFLDKDRQPTISAYANFVVGNPTKEEISAGNNVPCRETSDGSHRF